MNDFPSLTPSSQARPFVVRYTYSTGIRKE